MKKKFSKLLAAFILVSATTGFASAKDFSDLSPNHWAYSQIKALANDSVVVGYPDGTFQADQPVTRAEFATMVIKALRQENSPLAEAFEFVDVPYSHWAYNMIQKAQAFDLVRGFPDGTYRPKDSISKAEAIVIVIASVNTGDMTETQARNILKRYVDLNQIPGWALIPAGQSENLNMTAHNPEDGNKFMPFKKTTRAEVSVNLFNMRKQALKNPNDKLKKAMKPKVADGIILDNVEIDGFYATIPAGSLIPVKMVKALSSQKHESGEVFISKTYDNIVTKEKFLLIPKDTNISGEISGITPARYFIRNGKMILNTNTVVISNKKRAEFPGNIDTNKPYKNWLAKAVRFVVKGRKVTLREGQVSYVKTSRPIKIDLANTVIINR